MYWTLIIFLFVGVSIFVTQHKEVEFLSRGATCALIYATYEVPGIPQHPASQRHTVRMGVKSTMKCFFDVRWYSVPYRVLLFAIKIMGVK